MPQTIENTVVVDFEFERATKGTLRFAEVVGDGETAAIGTLYVKKDILTAAGVDVEAPEGKRITATFTVA